jgi:Amt family ammonium transporter
MTPEELERAVKMASTVKTEVYYWWCTAVMVLIHTGFLACEMGASRVKNTLASGLKNILAFAFTVAAFYAIGRWIYLAMYRGLSPDLEAGAAGVPWSMAIGPTLGDNATCVFRAAFRMFSATTASILSGAVSERIRLSAFIILGIALGSFVWILAASWGWHPTGWLTTRWGFHGTAGAGCVHTVAGFFSLGVLIQLGGRIGRFNADGSANEIAGHSMPMTVIGLMMIIVAFFCFLGACIIWQQNAQWMTIFNTPATLSAFAFNALMGFAGGVIGAYVMSRGNPFWMMSGALARIISVAPGLELYYPPLAFLVAFGSGCIIKPVATLIEEARIDDAVGAVAVHGATGCYGVVMVGVLASGYPNAGEAPAINPDGQIGGAVVMALLGLVPGFVIAFVLEALGRLRVASSVEELGLDLAEIDTHPYPENSTPATGNAAARLAPRAT